MAREIEAERAARAYEASEEVQVSPPPEPRTSWQIASLRLENIRGFSEFQMSPRPASTTLLIGENGTGKSTILRCLALALCDSSDAPALLAEPLGGYLAHGAETGEIVVTLSNGKEPPIKLKTRIERKGEKESLHKDSEPPSGIFAVGYGSGRSALGTEESHPTSYRLLDSLRSLFRYNIGLAKTELILRRMRDLDKSRYSFYLQRFKRLLQLSPDDEIEILRGGGLTLSGPIAGHGSIPFEALADGYRSTLSWVIDFFGWALRARMLGEEGIKGILLLDEIEQHLHPTIQASVVDELQNLFPGVQSFITTHSPPVALSVDPRDLISLKKAPSGEVKATAIPDFSTFSIEDMYVAKALFDAPVLPPDLVEKLERHQELAAIPEAKRTDDEQSQLIELAQELLQVGQVPDDQG